ncbi:MAG: hypothetical protein R3C01_01365 [Planctomycetaceae bacterium]
MSQRGESQGRKPVMKRGDLQKKLRQQQTPVTRGFAPLKKKSK